MAIKIANRRLYFVERANSGKQTLTWEPITGDAIVAAIPVQFVGREEEIPAARFLAGTAAREIEMPGGAVYLVDAEDAIRDQIDAALGGDWSERTRACRIVPAPEVDPSDDAAWQAYYQSTLVRVGDAENCE